MHTCLYSRFVLPVLVFTMCTSCTVSSAFKAGQPLDFSELTKHAEKGDCEAQFVLGAAFLAGDKVEQDYSQAAKWLRQAAELGHFAAQFNVALLLESGENGVKRDPEGAVKWYLRSAEQGFMPAQLRLGEILDNGVGVAVSYEDAAKWYRKAAQQGNGWAQFLLGVLLSKGEWEPRNKVEACLWLKLAARNLAYDRERQNRAQEKLTSVKSTMTSEQVAEADRRAEAFVAVPMAPKVNCTRKSD